MSIEVACVSIIDIRRYYQNNQKVFWLIMKWLTEAEDACQKVSLIFTYVVLRAGLVPGRRPFLLFHVDISGGPAPWSLSIPASEGK